MARFASEAELETCPKAKVLSSASLAKRAMLNNPAETEQMSLHTLKMGFCI